MTTLVRAPETVFAPRQPHRRAEHRQIHLTHHRPVLDLSLSTARRTKSRDLNLLDQQFHIRPGTSIGQHPHVLQAHQRLDDPIRLRHDEGATVFVLHTSKTAAPSSPIRTGHAAHKTGRPKGRPPRQDPKTPHRVRSEAIRAPPAGFEPAHPAPEAGALSPELRGLRPQERVPAGRQQARIDGGRIRDRLREAPDDIRAAMTDNWRQRAMPRER